MGERLTDDGDTEVPGGGEVGQTEATEWIALCEDHLLFRAMQSAPPLHSPVQKKPLIRF